MSIKIALIRSSYSLYGGVETFTLNLIKELLKRDVKIALLTKPDQKWNITDKNLEIIPLGISKGNRLWQIWLFDKEVSKYLTSHSFDCIFSLDRTSYATHVHCGGVHKTFLEIQGGNSSFIRHIFRKINLFHIYTLYIEKKSFTHPELKKIQCCSNMIKNEIQEQYHVDSDKLQVIYNSFDWENIGTVFEQRSAISSELLKEHSINPEWKCLLFLGSGFERKGLDTAIQGLFFLPEIYHLIVVGKNSYKYYLRYASKSGVINRVHFLGPHENGWKYASICKGFVLPSKYEPFGIAAAEAQAMGLPVLVSDMTGYSELILPHKNGVILQSPMTKENIKTAFVQLKDLIENPVMTASEIRKHIKILDNRVICKTLINDFLFKN